MDINQLLETIKSSSRPYDVDLITRAYKLAESSHDGQLRKTGEKYIIHPVNVAAILLEYGLDSESVAAALLHDVVEDTKVGLPVIEREFGAQVAFLVDGVTKLGQIPFSSVEEQQAENVRKMLLAMSRDIRVMLIKLCDRLHNMRTLQALRDEKRREISLETMEVYAPIAHRLGMSNMKEELEDLALKYLDPVGYADIETMLAGEYVDTSFVERMVKKIEERLTEMNMNGFTTYSRVKSVYGIYRKLYVQNRSPEEIFDIYAIRVIVNTVAECYNALGVLHDLFNPLPHRFKDYISTPKPNGYKSIHTTVIGREGVPFEVQIRTYEMNYDAEYGIAAHWKYKANLSGDDPLDERLAWVRQLLETQQDSEDVVDILRNIRSDLLPEEVYVFTPKGDVMNLPAGSTVIDFAYAIHSAVGNRMTGAKVNGRIVPISYKIKTGEIVEIITGPKDKGPGRDWLKIVQTSEAKSKIRSWFKRERREENIAEGKMQFDKEMKRNLISVPADQYDDFLDELVKRQHLNTVSELYASIGYGGIQMSHLMVRVKEMYQKLVGEGPTETVATVTEKRDSGGGIIVQGIDNCLVKFARCCNPLPGDDIIGFVTRGHGVTVHKSNCPMLLSADDNSVEKMRLIEVSWASTVKQEFRTSLEIVCQDRTGLTAEITQQFSTMRVPIYKMNIKTTADGRGIMNVTVGVINTEHVDSIISKLRKIKDVQYVERTNK